MGDFVPLEIARIRELVGDRALVLGACSGGVDSTVGAKLMREAIGDRFHAIAIDNGLMRLNECEEVKENLGKHLGINLTVVDGSELFLSRLAGVTDPEKKRKIIGSTCMWSKKALTTTILTSFTVIDLFEKEAIRVCSDAFDTDYIALTNLPRLRRKPKTPPTVARWSGSCKERSILTCESLAVQFVSSS